MSQFELSEVWETSELASIVNFIDYRGKTPTKTSEGIPLITAKNIRDGYINREPREFIAEDAYDSWMTRGFPQLGDLVITTEAPMGNVAVLDIQEKFALAQRAICLSFVEEPRLSKFIYYYLRSQSFKSALVEKATGTTVQGIKAAELKKIPVPIAPLAEQKVIADKLDTLLAQVESIKARLERIPEILKQFRQSVLAAAVSGKLTEEWRVAKGITIETWKYEAAKNVCEKVQSGSTPRENPFDQNGTVPFLKVYNIVDQKIDFDYKPQFITSETHSKGSSARSVAFPNDVLMNIVGPPLGKVAILTNQFPEWNLNQAITLFRVKKELLDHKYLYYVLCEGALVREVMPETKGSVGQVNISLSQCREAILPVPSIEEQREVVLCIDKLFNNADVIDTYVHSALNRVNNLTQSILAKAFRGELTAGWREANTDLISGENSAEALLKRIKAERESAKPTTKRGRAET
ncbi:restriction endonuclease subunit S [Acinetobacter baumannii]|nr:restriction endonuclease subunit S [Acinetobacter baumannii]